MHIAAFIGTVAIAFAIYLTTNLLIAGISLFGMFFMWLAFYMSLKTTTNNLLAVHDALVKEINQKS